MATLAPVSAFGTLALILIIINFFSLLVTANRVFECIYAFGNSLTDTGNALLYQDSINVSGPEAHLPYGHIFFHYPTGRFSDGRLVVDFLAEKVKAPHFLLPFLGLNDTHTSLINFAVGGATAQNVDYLNSTYNISISMPYSIDKQLLWFSTLPISEDKWAISRALIYLGEIGVNDYNSALLNNFPVDVIIKDFVPNVINIIKNTTEFLIARGAKYIVIEGGYPIGCASLYTAVYFVNATKDKHGCVEELQKLNKDHDILLKKLILDLTMKYSSNIHIIFFDQLKAYIEILKHPSYYGFTNTNATDPCFDSLRSPNLTNAEDCQQPSTYLNWDGIHFTEALHNVLLNLFYTKGFVMPYPNFLTS